MFTETSYACVLTAKFGLSSMVLTNFRQEGGNFIPLPPPKPPQGEVLGSGPGLGLVGLRASAYSFIWGETRAQVFSCKFCEMFENTFFIEQLRWLLLCLIFFLVPKHPYSAICIGYAWPFCVLFWVGGRQPGCSARCVYAPGMGGCSGAAARCAVLGCVCVNCVGWSLSGDGGVRCIWIGVIAMIAQRFPYTAII